MEISASSRFDVPASTIWSLLEDFSAISNWWPTDGLITIQRVECEGEGVGMIRHIYNHGMEKPVSERLDYQDAVDKILILSIVGDRPGLIDAYVAIGKVIALAESECKLDYRGYISCDQRVEEKVERNIRITWDRMFAGLRNASS
ncbi:SRPBCC family protein [Parahaliea maris]|uniref:SRPBCC family protein n=1 Tax=Parahaliea maris TaxID=2716870 RepID=A0A5C9A6A8_9GAMM|nr:SRPBCC family protein [Parahaliea maris]TXS96465.1 SRPBCC family protein [Parahaliea maris]